MQLRRRLLILLLLLPILGFANHFVGGAVSFYQTAADASAGQFRVRLLLVSDCDASLAEVIFDNPAPSVAVFNSQELMIAQDSSDWTRLDSGQHISSSFPYCAGIETLCTNPVAGNAGYKFALWEGVIDVGQISERYAVTYQQCCYYNGLTQMSSPAQTNFVLQGSFETAIGCQSTPLTLQLPMRACLGRDLVLASMNEGLAAPFELVEPASMRTGEATPTPGYDFSQPLVVADQQVFPEQSNADGYRLWRIRPLSPSLGLLARQTIGCAQHYSENVIFAQFCQGLDTAAVSLSSFSSAGSDTVFDSNLPDSLRITGLSVLDSTTVVYQPSELMAETDFLSDSLLVLEGVTSPVTDAIYPYILKVKRPSTTGCTFKEEPYFVRWIASPMTDGIREAHYAERVRVSPNPTEDGKVRLHTEEGAFIESITLYTQSGVTLAHWLFTTPQRSTELTLPESSGVYLISIQTTNGRVVKRVVRQ